MYLNRQCDYLVTGKSSVSQLFALRKNDFNKIKSTFDENIMKILNDSSVNLRKIEKIKKLVIELFNIGESLKRIKLLIKKLNFYFFKKQFEFFMQGKEIKDVEEIINSLYISEISQFLNSKMTELDFIKFFNNNLVEKTYSQQEPSSKKINKSGSFIDDDKNFEMFVNLEQSKNHTPDDELVENLQGSFEFSSISSSPDLKEKYLKTLKKLLTNQKEEIENLIPNTFTKKPTISQIKRKSSKKSKKDKKVQKSTSSCSNSPKTVYNIFKCTNSFNQNFQFKLEKFQNLLVTNEENFNLNLNHQNFMDSPINKISYEVCQNYSMSFSKNSWYIKNEESQINLESPTSFELIKASSIDEIRKKSEIKIMNGLNRIFKIIKTNNK
jgi:hypothetical protein